MSRIRYHWNETSYTLSLLDDFTRDDFHSVEAVYLNSPRVHLAPKRRGGLSSYNREYIYRGDYVEPDSLGGVAYGTLSVDGLEIPSAWVSHYHAHALSALWASDFEDADVVCLDGGGDFGFYGALFRGSYSELQLSERLTARHGRSYHDFSQHVYGVNEGFFESKVMAIASYGTSSRSELQFFDPTGGLTDLPPSVSVHDIARLQEQFEEAVLELISAIEPKSDALCCAGGCFLNVGLNRRIADSGLYKRVFVPPFAGDAGTAIGCALYGYRATHGVLPDRKLAQSPFLGDDLRISRNALEDLVTDFEDSVGSADDSQQGLLPQTIPNSSRGRGC